VDLYYTKYEHVIESHRCYDGKGMIEFPNKTIKLPFAINSIAVMPDRVQCIGPLISPDPKELFKMFVDSLIHAGYVGRLSIKIKSAIMIM
jgi:hypothetical protein